MQPHSLLSGCQAAHCTGLILGTGIILAFLGGF